MPWSRDHVGSLGIAGRVAVAATAVVGNGIGCRVVVWVAEEGDGG
jgi:hypothetical protein